jgi:hypothetical protein
VHLHLHKYYLNFAAEYFCSYEKDFENSLIMLFNMEKGANLEKLKKGSFCITYSLSGWPSWHRADIEGIIGEKANFECKISVFRLFCPQLWLEPSLLDNRDQIVEIKISEESIPFQVTFFIIN